MIPGRKPSHQSVIVHMYMLSRTLNLDVDARPDEAGREEPDQQGISEGVVRWDPSHPVRKGDVRNGYYSIIANTARWYSQECSVNRGE